MGCWNKTCGLSNLHIYAGMPVYVFVLSKKSYNPCGTKMMFNPCLLPFNSQYNDYGGGEQSNGFVFNLLMNSIKEKLVEVQVGENEYHDIAVTKHSFDETLFFDAIHEDRLRVILNSKEESLNFTMIRKDVVDSILKDWSSNHYVSGNGFIKISWEDIQKCKHEFLLVMKSIGYQTPSTLSQTIFSMADSGNIAAEYLSKHIIMIDQLKLVRFTYSILELLKEKRFDELDELISAAILGVFIDQFMISTRKHWHPGGHEGSQDNECSQHRLLSKCIIDLMNEEENKS